MASRLERLYQVWLQAEKEKGAHAKAIAYEVSRGRTVGESTLNAYREAEQAEEIAYTNWMEALSNG